jgi:hypothetical protein
MPSFETPNGDKKQKYTLEPGVHGWKVVERVEFGDYQFYTEDRISQRSGDEQIQLVLLVGSTEEHIQNIQMLTFSDAAMWKVAEFLKSAGIYAGEGVPVCLMAKMCIGLTGKCRTANEIPEGKKYERTDIAEFLEAPEQHPEKIPGYLKSENAADAAKRLEAVGEPDYSDDIPW